MFRFTAKKLIFLPLVTALLAVVAVFGITTRASNDVVVLAQLWETGLAFWQDAIVVEPGQEFKISYFAGNYSATAAVTAVTIVDGLPVNTSYIPGSAFVITGTRISSGIWEPFSDNGASPFLESGVTVTSDGALEPAEFGNYKYSVKVDDFLPSGTTQLSWVGPVLHFTDASGEQTVSNLQTTNIGIENLPNISSLTLLPASASYKLGDVIAVAIAGTPGKTASVKIGAVAIALAETASGAYAGSYTVQAGDNVSAAPRAFLANDNGQGAYLDFQQNIILDAVLPAEPTGLSAILNADATVTLAWIAPGILTDVDHFNIYSDNGSGEIDFNTPTATAPATATQYTTAALANDVLYKFAVRSVDLSGNTDGNTNIASKSTDVTPPEPPASLVQPTSLNSQILKFQTTIPIEFVWASSPAADLVKYRLEIDDSSDFSSIITSQETIGTTTAYTLQTSTIALPEGIYFWRVSAIDDVDLISTPTITPDNSFEIDNTAPTITVTQPADQSHVNDNFTVSGAAADSGAHLDETTGIANVGVSLTNLNTGQHWDGTAWSAIPTFLTATSTNEFATWSYQFAGAITSGNFYVINARVTDKAGQQTSSSLISLTGDIAAPTFSSITLTNTTLGSTSIFKNNQSIVLTATITDNLGQGGMSVNNIRADLSAITGQTGDNAVAPASFDTATGLATWTAITANSSGDGAKTVTITATDLAGNSGTGSNSITADNTPPTVTTATLTSPSASGIAWRGNSTKNITWDNTQIADANLATNPITLEYTTDGTAWTQIATNEANDGTYDWLVPSLDITTVRVRLTAKDMANNEATDSSNNDFTIDSMAPVFSNTVLTNSTLSIATLVKNGDAVILTSDITDNLLQSGLTPSSITANFTAITNNPADNAVSPTSYNPATGAAVWNFKTAAGTGNGDLSLSITATDLAGNAATFNNTAIIVADNTPPIITANTLVFPSASGIFLAGNVSSTITWLASDISDTHLGANPVRLEYDDGLAWTIISDSEANDGSFGWLIPGFNDNTMTVRIWVTDQAGNSAYDDSNNFFTIDSTPPTVPATALTSPNGGEAWKQGTARAIAWNSADITDNFGLATNPITLSFNYTLAETCTPGGTCSTPSGGGSIGVNQPNDGSDSWTTPLIDSTGVRVRLTATDAAGNTSYDESDSTFSIGLPPAIVQARAMNDTTIEIEWNKALASAGVFGNYTATGISPTAAVISSSNNKIVILTVASLNNTGFTAADLVMAADTITDTFNFKNEILSNTTIIDRQSPQSNIGASYPTYNQLIVDVRPTFRVPVSEAPGPAAGFKLDDIPQSFSYNAAEKAIFVTPATALSSGQHTWHIGMVDMAGLASSAPTVSFWIDDFLTNMTIVPVNFSFSGNLSDVTDSSEQQRVSISTYGAGYTVYALLSDPVDDGFGSSISSISMKQTSGSWIDLNGANLVQVAQVGKLATPSALPVVMDFVFDLRAAIPSIIQTAGNYEGRVSFVVSLEY